jgi:hypothetical protein
MTLLRRAAAIASIALGAAALAATAGGTIRSGLYGTVTRGPTRPVCEVDQPCEAPAADVTLVFYREGRRIARVRTNDQGKYRITLRPGRYLVRTTAPSIRRIIDPPLVTVPRGRYARVNFSIDTGIR